MERFGIIGYPAAHSLSPKLFSEAYGGKYPYDIIETPDFDEAWARFIKGYRAVNVTMPFKALAAQRADIKSTEVERTGAANILVKTPEGIAAHNSDFFAILSILSELSGSIISSIPSNPLQAIPDSEGQATDTEGFNPIEAESSGQSVTAAVIGTGGAGKAAIAAAQDCKFDLKIFHHDEILDSIKADIIIYTLPSAVDGFDKLDCRYLIEANYKDPVLDTFSSNPDGSPRIYVPGLVWLKRQAVYGYRIMTGEEPERS